MRITRRTFLEQAAVVVAGIPASWAAVVSKAKLETRNSKFASGFDFRVSNCDSPISSFGSSRACGLVDLRARCDFPESAMGYRAALADAGISIVPAEPSAAPACSMLIIPAAFEITPGLVRTIHARLEAGGDVLLGSGAAFAQPKEYQAHRAGLRERLGIRIEPPVDLARGGCGRGRVPYVVYDWPCAVKIRDFSRVIPVDTRACEVIGRAGDVPMALRRQVGRRSLIFLGSPLGPALRAGDADARRWLAKVIL